jgi:nitroimidazol reductase NimA-like FMN-containing flavoprotein (pyridoxamine 5'-phosphate oxidase superfamily)
MEAFTPTERTRLKRRPQRAVYDRAQVYSILDEGFVCHVGFCVDGQTYVIPTAYGRAGDRIYIHGSAASRMLRSLAQGLDVCVTVTLVDGFVLGRSAFHASLNYRSVMMLGKARLVTDASEKREGMRCFMDHVMPGRWDEVRQPNEKELAATSVLVLPLEEVSAKVRTGPPIDDEEDLAWPVWAGVVPLHTKLGEPVPDQHLMATAPPFDPRKFVRFHPRGV